MSVIVKRKAQDTDDRMISEFRKMVMEYNLIEYYKSRMFHLKPSAQKNILNNTRKRRKPSRPMNRRPRA